jgi:hypothetical protein
MKWWFSEALHFDSEGPKDQKSSDLLYHSSFELWYPNEAQLIQLLLKILKENAIIKILKPQAALQKHPIYTLESSKHPLNLVRLSF